MPHHPDYRSPADLFTPTGPWSILAEVGPFVFLAGMRGIDPATDRLVDGEEERVRQVFHNIERAAAAAGAGLRDVMRLTVYVTDMDRHRPVVNRVQEEFWSGGFPPRTIVEVSRLNQDDWVEVEATLYRPDGAG
jgi:enamine deaminase RidA (YjgF/YER057c/UK114 family)